MLKETCATLRVRCVRWALRRRAERTGRRVRQARNSEATHPSPRERPRDRCPRRLSLPATPRPLSEYLRWIGSLRDLWWRCGPRAGTRTRLRTRAARRRRDTLPNATSRTRRSRGRADEESNSQTHKEALCCL